MSQTADQYIRELIINDCRGFFYKLLASYTTIEDTNVGCNFIYNKNIIAKYNARATMLTVSDNLLDHAMFYLKEGSFDNDVVYDVSEDESTTSSDFNEEMVKEICKTTFKKYLNNAEFFVEFQDAWVLNSGELFLSKRGAHRIK